MESKRHIQLPSHLIKEENITPMDLLVYANIKRYANSKTKSCFPSLETIKNDCGLSIPTIRNNIANLEKAGYIKVIRSKEKGKSNQYIFEDYDKFEPFSYEFLDKKDLTPKEKAYILATQQYMYKDNGEGKICMTDSELSEKINWSINTIKKYDKELAKKNYLVVVKTAAIDPESKVRKDLKIYNLNALEQAIVFTLCKHEERIEDHEERIKRLEDKLLASEKENKILKEYIAEQQRKEGDSALIIM